MKYPLLLQSELKTTPKQCFNMYKKLVSIVVLFCSCCFAGVQAKELLVTSPNGTVTVAVGVKANKPYYTVKYGEKKLVTPSHLGFLLGDSQLGNHVTMTGKHSDSKDDTWVQPWGEDERVRNHYNELTVNFKEKNGRRMDVVFRVFDDGVGFRYILPNQKGEKFVIQDELTEITLAHDAKAWSIPTNRTAYFEGIYNMLFNGRSIRSAYDDHPDLYTTPVKMLVVTTSTYTNSTPFQTWLNWKKQKGIDVDVQTVTSSTSSANVQSKHFLKISIMRDVQFFCHAAL